MKKIVLVLILLCGVASAQTIDTVDIPTKVIGPYGYHMGVYFNGADGIKWIEGTEIIGMNAYKITNEMYRNQFMRPIFDVARQWPYPCGMWWNDLYGRDIKVILKDGSEIDLVKGTVVGVRSEYGLSVGIGYVEEVGILKFTAVYPDDSYEPGVTGMKDGEVFFVYLNGKKCMEPFVFESGYKQHEVTVLTLE